MALSPYGILCRITNPIDLGQGKLDRPHVLFGVDVLTLAGVCWFPGDWRQHDLFRVVFLHVVCVAMVGCWLDPVLRPFLLLFYCSLGVPSLFFFFALSWFLSFCISHPKGACRAIPAPPASPKLSEARSQTVLKSKK